MTLCQPGRYSCCIAKSQPLETLGFKPARCQAHLLLRHQQSICSIFNCTEGAHRKAHPALLSNTTRALTSHQLSLTCSLYCCYPSSNKFDVKETVQNNPLQHLSYYGRGRAFVFIERICAPFRKALFSFIFALKVLSQLLFNLTSDPRDPNSGIQISQWKTI